MTMNRRHFLALAGSASGMALSPLGRRAWAMSGDTPAKSRLVVIMLRGAVDGLNVVAPYGDRNYASLRPSIAVANPGSEDGLLDLDGHFGLHPALSALMPAWQAKRLAFVHACGSPDPTRSHFDAQDYLESGTPGIKSTASGWMNRLIGVLPGGHGPIQAISLGATRPRILSGTQTATNFPLGPNAGKPTPLDRPQVAAAFASLYDGNDAMSAAFQDGQAARHQLDADLSDSPNMVGPNMTGGPQMAEEQKIANNGAPDATGFPATASRLARLLVTDNRIQIAFADLGGWDTHINEGNGKGQLANHLRPLGDGLAALANGLGPRLDDTLVLVMSEFGRTAHENGNRGTDHGHGNVMWVMGGQTDGGRIHGRWPGLDSSALYQGRDLAVTTDFRTVIALALRNHLRLDNSQIASILPQGPSPDSALSRLIRV